MSSIKAVALPSAAGVVAFIASINPFRTLPCLALKESVALSEVNLSWIPRHVFSLVLNP